MPKKKAFIHIVVGQDGDYEEYCKWNVCAYTDKKKADKHVDLLHNWVKAKEAEIEEKHGYVDSWKFKIDAVEDNPYDSNMDSLDSSYYVESLEIKKSLPEEKDA